jgi:PST family polysaccharide transporter
VTFKTQVAKGLKWQAISIVGRQLLSLVVFTTLARLLEPSAFGLIGLIGVYLGFIGMFADQGIGAALIQRKDLEPEHIDTAFWTNIGCSVFLCLGTIALAGPVSHLLGDIRLAPLLQWSSLSLVITALSAVHSSLLLKAMDFRAPTIRTLIANTAGGVVGVIMALRGYGVWALIGQQLCTAIAGAMFLWTISSYRPSFRFSIRHFRDLSGVGWSIFATSLLWFFTSRLDQIAIGRFVGIPALGLYVIGNKIPDMAKTLTHAPLDGISLPALSRLQDDHKKMCETIYKGMELNATVSFAVFVGLAAISSDLVPFLFGAKWLPATTISSLLSLYALTIVLGVFFHASLLASGGAGRYVHLSIWQVIGVGIACVLGIQFGVNYLIIGMIVNSLIMTIPALLFLKGRIGLSPLQYCKPCLIPALAASFMAILIWFTSSVLPKDILPAFLIASKIVIGAIAYLGFVFIFKRTSLITIIDTVGHAFQNRSKVQS